MDQELLIVSGMSGAGKSQVVDALEDMGYFCADNVPPALISTFAALPKQSQGRIGKIALVVDVRSRDTFSYMIGCLVELRESGTEYRLVFLDCANETIETRYKETRRQHPLIGDEFPSTSDAVREERRMLEMVRQSAHVLIDTTLLSPSQLKVKIRELFPDEEGDSAMRVNCMSFGFKYGLPRDSDLVFDIRCLPNPFYIEELRPRTGLDAEVADYVLSGESARMLLDKIEDLLDYLTPLYIQEGKSQLVISVGCTGGRHRSVVFTERIAAHLSQKGISAGALHRDIRRGNYN